MLHFTFGVVFSLGAEEIYRVPNPVNMVGGDCEKLFLVKSSLMANSEWASALLQCYIHELYLIYEAVSFKLHLWEVSELPTETPDWMFICLY